MLETKRLVLRPFSIDDAPDIYQMASDLDVGIHAGWPPHTSIENTKEIIENILMKDGQYAVVLKENGKVIGACGLANDPKRENKEVKMLGYWIGKEYWGNGFMYEAAKSVMEYGFQEQGYTRISIYHYAYNKRSEAVARKLGFIYEGHQRESTKRFDGKVLDDILYSISKEQYFALREK